jgi:hypothetical protein
MTWRHVMLEMARDGPQFGANWCALWRDIARDMHVLKERPGLKYRRSRPTTLTFTCKLLRRSIRPRNFSGDRLLNVSFSHAQSGRWSPQSMPFARAARPDNRIYNSADHNGFIYPLCVPRYGIFGNGQHQIAKSFFCDY